MAQKTSKKSKPKKNSKTSNEPHLLKDHPHLGWLIIIFLTLSLFVFWKAYKNSIMIDQYIKEMNTIPVEEMPTPTITGNMAQ